MMSEKKSGDPIDVKIYFEGQARRFSLDRTDDAFSVLLSRLDEAYPTFSARVKKNHLMITYKDDEGDNINCTNDRDFLYYVDHYLRWFPQEQILRLWITKRVIPVTTTNTSEQDAAPSKVEVTADEKNAKGSTLPIKNQGIAGMWNVGEIVRIKSIASGRNLRLNADGTVDGNGTDDDITSLVRVGKCVRNETNGKVVVAFQSLLDAKKWLSVDNEGKLLSSKGDGKKQSNFVVIHHKNKEPNRVSFRSGPLPACYVGILTDGSPKSPVETATGDHGSFLVTFIGKK